MQRSGTNDEVEAECIFKKFGIVSLKHFKCLEKHIKWKLYRAVFHLTLKYTSEIFTKYADENRGPFLMEVNKGG